VPDTWNLAAFLPKRIKNQGNEVTCRGIYLLPKLI